jgi:hypothetical protein
MRTKTMGCMIAKATMRARSDRLYDECHGYDLNGNPLPPRPIRAIAREISRDWGAKVYFGAVPYLRAMLSLDSVDDDYGADSGRSVVLYFLSNATTYRGETARRLKAELKKALGK